MKLFKHTNLLMTAILAIFTTSAFGASHRSTVEILAGASKSDSDFLVSKHVPVYQLGVFGRAVVPEKTFGYMYRLFMSRSTEISNGDVFSDGENFSVFNKGLDVGLCFSSFEDLLNICPNIGVSLGDLSSNKISRSYGSRLGLDARIKISQSFDGIISATHSRYDEVIDGKRFKSSNVSAMIGVAFTPYDFSNKPIEAVEQKETK